jgi:xanthine dehydrogenase accessory factor
VRDLAEALRGYLIDGRPFALATVVGSSGSTPRPLGSVMAVTADGEVLGSLSGGCVEGAVYDAAQAVLASGLPSVETFGVSDDDGFSIGLTCGGALEVLVAVPSYALLEHVLDHLDREEPVLLATVVEGERRGAQVVVCASGVLGSTGEPGLDAAVAKEALGQLSAGGPRIWHVGARGECQTEEVSVLLQGFVPPSRLLVFGATDVAAALATMGRFLGYRVTVCDPRPTFTTRARFPSADELVCAWPDAWFAAEVEAGRIDERTVVAVLTHDDRFDVSLLALALRSPAGYVGAMGSRRTHDARERRLLEAGLDRTELERLRSPIGLDLQGRTAEETAVSLAAELVLLRGHGTAQPLSQTRGDIHASSR